MFSLNPSDFAKLCAVILTINEENIYAVCKTASFNKIWEILFLKRPLNRKNIEAAKKEIIAEYKKQNSADIQKSLIESLIKLHKEDILDAQKLKEYQDIFTVSAKSDNANLTVQTQKIEQVSIDKTFWEKLDILSELSDNLFELVETPSQQARLKQVKKALSEKSFSIGITGIMNAGKSTLLNAILRADILGTAVVPETANLTILKYASSPEAIVNFWSKQEWKAIEKSGEFLPQIAKFIEQTKSKFGSGLDDFITDEGRSDKINIQDISLYTSSAKSNMRCNLVKSVELYTDLAFLKDGVTIVDTPGLDDPVIKREEITKEYLNSCDLMVHLMNAAQSATAKDVDFIIDALTYQGISRLLVIITRVDTINEEELNEVINYTKTSIKAQLEKQNKEALFQTIIEKIEFIPVAAKLALMHRTGRSKEAENLGYSEEKSGIFAVENYLNSVLFGSGSEKANLLIASNAKILHITAAESLLAYKKEYENLNKSSEELKRDLENLQSQNSIKEANIETLLLSLKNALSELEEFAKTLLLELDARIHSLHGKIFSRVFDDVKYELAKNSRKPSNERITYIVQNGLKDGILDLTRDYRFSFSKQSTAMQEKLLLRFEDLKIDLTVESFDVKAFFASNRFGLIQDFEALSARILSILKKCSKNSLDEFGENLNALLEEEFVMIKSRLDIVLTNLNNTLLNEFQTKNSYPLNLLRDGMREEIASLNKQINLLELHTNEAEKRGVLIQKRFIKLQDIIEKSAGLHGTI
ncbi:MAG: dynamin family protein [Campylobacteraceae bacterium]|jgi:predicted GTPase|nr:dynamin family protein [Campylobacteraceae bacterium]